MRVLVIADDLTGANDTAVQFAAAGLGTATLFDASNLERTKEVAAECDVLAVTSESRNLSPEEASSKVSELAETILSISRPCIAYKKIDSTLRGNVRCEISALRKAGLREAPAIAAPGYPGNKRIVCGGYLLVDGQPLSRTYAAKDVLAPVTTSKVADFLSDKPDEVGHLEFSAFESGKAQVLARLTEILAHGYTNVVVDSLDQADLDILTEVLFELSRPFLWVGSAGLALSLSRALSSAADPRVGSLSEAHKTPERSAHLFVIGSMNPKSIAQVEEVERQGAAQVFYLNERERAGADAFSTTVSEHTVLSSQRMKSQGPARGLAEKAKSALSSATSKAVSRGGYSTLILSGGDTAFAVLRALESTGLEILEEVLPGIPYGRIIDGPNRGLGVVTKAGGFGDRDCLISIGRWLCQRGL
ncbi:four-carbon acid sugar kinase family protein [Candidatus Dojkabacteria bacterium]|uniref:Four-carbon acid sugar kinase family protein n=1 Tax=Candidatus Dojkabacteria bacterium TaxID=2099670 RepID=A0A847EUD1_9BACT|nr:four-carbon acid sugar kinase family protein [Candidatus Dojkabacteria bacterium]